MLNVFLQGELLIFEKDGRVQSGYVQSVNYISRVILIGQRNIRFCVPFWRVVKRGGR